MQTTFEDDQPAKLKIMSVPTVDISPVERRYICGVNSCKLFYQRFHRPGLTHKCSLLLIHGFGEHVGRFYHVILELIDARCDVHTIDLRGHGLSGGPRSDGNFDDFINDISILHRIALTSAPKLPVFLYGQSMGGMLVLAYALLDKTQRIRGVIATSPWLRLSRLVQPKWWKIALLKLGWPLFQEFLLSSNVDPCSLSSVDGVASAAINDRLVLPYITVRMAFQIISGAQNTLKHASILTTPLLLIHGSSDQLTDGNATLEFADAASSSDKTVRIYQGAFHEIHNDIDRSQLFTEVNEWVDIRCSSQFSTDDNHEELSPGRTLVSRMDDLNVSLARRKWAARLAFLVLFYLAGLGMARRKAPNVRAALAWPIRLFYLTISTLY
uniref:Serine aminopeptidase S33 domain-containing protein n=1 Tax=Spongospora subterranea TaxID=70186 RepID=A0A0H5QU45_9EUKA|eukprot:CRZ05257.1 hypothetical protein [Spongospora subterranea]